jgi:hypothetical protein
MLKAIKALAILTAITASASVAFAQSPPPYSGGYGPYPDAPGGVLLSGVSDRTIRLCYSVL